MLFRSLKLTCVTHETPLRAAGSAAGLQVPRNSSKGLQISAAYAGELGYELMLFLPLVHYWHSQGVPVRTLGPLGSAPFYHFSPNHTEVRATISSSWLIIKATVELRVTGL